MKKILAITIVALFLSTTSFAQLLKLNYGPKIGVNVSNHTLTLNAGGYSTSPLVGVQAGAFIGVQLPLKFAAQLEVLYSQAGAKYKSANTFDLKQDFVSIPLIVKYNVFDKLNIYVGPQIDFLISAKTIYATGGSPQDDKENENTSYFSIATGAEYNLPFGLVVSARYQPTFKEQFKKTIFNINSKRNLFTFSVGYNLPF